MHNPEDYLARLKLHFNMLPSMTPEKWNFWEPINKPYEADYDWSKLYDDGIAPDGLLWKKTKKTRAWGSFNIAQKKRRNGTALDTHADEHICSELKQTNISELIAYVKQSSVHFQADLAKIECLTEQYKKEVLFFTRKYQGILFSDTIDPFTHEMRHWLDEIYWVTVFGDAYVRLFGMEKLLSVPAYKVEKLDANTVYIQLTENISDCVNNFSEVQKVRTAVKEHLNPNAFFHLEKAYYILGDEDEYPNFDLPIEGNVFDTPDFDLISDDFMDRNEE